MKSRFPLVLIIFVVVSCTSDRRTSEVTIRNDIQDENFNQIEVDQIQGASGLLPLKIKLSPGEESPLPTKLVTKFRVTREYKDFSRVYLVTCPAKKDKVLIKLIDIHLNRMPGGCLMTRVGERRSGSINWKD
jgi:hypothetical protein